MEFLNAVPAEMNANMKSMLEKMDAETEATRDKRMEANMNAWREETLSCQVTTAACLDSQEPNPEDMKSEVEHREVPTEEAAVKSTGTMMKRHRGRHLAAGRRGEPKKLTRGDCGSRRKLAAACMKVSRRSIVAWRKRNVFRKMLTQGNCKSRKRLTVAGRRMTRCAGVSWLRRGVVKKDCTRANVVQEIRRGRTFGRRRQPKPECCKGIRS
jgi:hypothetical protein